MKALTIAVIIVVIALAWGAAYLVYSNGLIYKVASPPATNDYDNTLSSTPMPTYYGKIDASVLQKDLTNTSNWPWDKNSTLAPWLYGPNANRTDYFNAYLLAQIKIYLDNGWSTQYLSGDTFNGYSWNEDNGMSPSEDPAWYTDYSQPDRQVYYFGLLNGTLLPGS